MHEIAAAKSPYRPANCPDLPPDAAGYQVRIVLSVSIFAGKVFICMILRLLRILSWMCALQVAVALVQSMKLQNGRSEAEQAEYFAKSLHKAWGVGDKNCDNGLVFLLSKDDRQVILRSPNHSLSCS